jgi:hypothetical protein
MMKSYAIFVPVSLKGDLPIANRWQPSKADQILPLFRQVFFFIRLCQACLLPDTYDSLKEACYFDFVELVAQVRSSVLCYFLCVKTKKVRSLPLDKPWAAE